MEEPSLARGDGWKPPGGHLQPWESSRSNCSVHEDMGPRGDCGSSGLNLGMGGEEVGLCSPAAFLGFSLQKWGLHLHESQPGGSPEDGKNTAGFPGIPSLSVLQDNILAREL